MVTTHDQMSQYGEPNIAEFDYEHLPDPYWKAVSKEFHDLALYVIGEFEPSSQRAQCLWDLLRAKDCAVRAAKNAVSR